MVGMGMGNQTALQFRKIDSVLHKMPNGIGRKIQKQRIVHERLTTSTDIPSAERTGTLAGIAFATERRNSFIRRRTEIGKFHIPLLFDFWIL